MRKEKSNVSSDFVGTNATSTEYNIVQQTVERKKNDDDSLKYAKYQIFGTFSF